MSSVLKKRRKKKRKQRSLITLGVLFVIFGFLHVKLFMWGSAKIRAKQAGTDHVTLHLTTDGGTTWTTLPFSR